MQNFVIAFNAVMPLLVYLLMGKQAARMGLIDEIALNQVNRALFGLFLPLTLFYNVYHSDFHQDFDAKTLGFVVGYAVLIYLLIATLTVLVEKNPKRRGVMLQGGIRTNSVLFGLPLAVALLGEKNLGLVSIVLAVIAPFNNVLSVLAFEIFREGKISVGRLVRAVLTNPMTAFTLVGVVLVVVGIHLPIFVEQAVAGVSRMATPLALITMGGLFRFDLLKKIDRDLILVLFFKLVLNPALAFMMAIPLGLRGTSIICVMIATAGPTAVSSFAQAVVMGGDEDLANEVVIFTSVLAMFTLVFWISILKNFGII